MGNRSVFMFKKPIAPDLFLFVNTITDRRNNKCDYHRLRFRYVSTHYISVIKILCIEHHTSVY